MMMVKMSTCSGVRSRCRKASESAASPSRLIRIGWAKSSSSDGARMYLERNASAGSAHRWPASEPRRPVRGKQPGRQSSTRRRQAHATSSRRAPRWARNRSDAPSAHWQSSTMRSSGAREARFAVSQYNPCRVENDKSSAEKASAGFPFSPRSQRQGGGTGEDVVLGPPAGRQGERLEHLAHGAVGEVLLERCTACGETVKPRPRASSVVARNSDVLPMPAGPSTTTRRPRALSASARQRSSSPSSRSRSSREPTPRSPDSASAPRPRVTTRLWQYRCEPEGAKSSDSVDKGQKLGAAATMPDGPRRVHPRGMGRPARTAPPRAAPHPRPR